MGRGDPWTHHKMEETMEAPSWLPFMHLYLKTWRARNSNATHLAMDIQASMFDLRQPPWSPYHKLTVDLHLKGLHTEC